MGLRKINVRVSEIMVHGESMCNVRTYLYIGMRNRCNKISHNDRHVHWVLGIIMGLSFGCFDQFNFSFYSF